MVEEETCDRHCIIICVVFLQGIRRCISAEFRRITRTSFDGITDGDSSDDIEVDQGRRCNDTDGNQGVQCGGVHGCLVVVATDSYGHKEMCQLFKRNPSYIKYPTCMKSCLRKWF